MEDQPTCGKGLAEHSVLPATLGGLASAMAENLEIHMQALDLTDPNARLEYEAYLHLTQEYREIAARLHATATRMAGYRDLPMGKHDERAMSDLRAREAFEKFVTLKHELLILLKKMAEQDQKMLVAMRGSG